MKRKATISMALSEFNNKVEGLSKLATELEAKIDSGEFDNNIIESLKRFEFFLGVTSNLLGSINKSYQKDIESLESY